MVALLAALAGNVISVACWGGWNEPPRKGDGQDYDNIAYNIAFGPGFGRDWSDPGFRRPYEEHNADGRYDEVLAFGGEFELTAFRPPVLPYTLAAIYRVFGRQFLIWRLLNATILAVAVGFAVLLAWRIAGRTPAVVVAWLGVCDPLTKKYAGYFLTEGLSCLLLVAIAWSMVMMFERRRVRYAALAGLVMGVAILSRSIFVMWLPFLLVLMVWLWTRSIAQSRRSVVLAVAAFSVVVVAVPAPWAIRNCMVLESVMPMGTQGGIGLPGGYCDRSYEKGGVWINVAPMLEQQLRRRHDDYDHWAPIIQEREQSKLGLTLAREWITANPGKLPVLAGLRLWRLWAKPKVYSLALLGLSCVGFWWGRARPGVVVLWSLVVMNCLVVMATYATRGGRFLMPVLPMLHILAAIGVWRIIQWQAQSKAARS